MALIIIAGGLDRFEVVGFCSRPVLDSLRDYLGAE